MEIPYKHPLLLSLAESEKFKIAPPCISSHGSSCCIALWHKLDCQSPPDRDLAHNRVLALSKLPAHCDAGDVRHHGQVGRQRGGGVGQGRWTRGVLRRDLDAEVLVQIVGRALLNHCEAHFVEPTGGGDRQLKTERKI